jgi:hypothetical protein
MRRVAIVALAILGLWAALVTAQTPPNGGYSWQLQVYQPGVDPATGAPFYALDLSPSIVTCSTTLVLPPTPTAPPVNPRTLWWTQSELPGQVCKADLTGQSGFVALPIGGPYMLTMTAKNETDVVSARGAADVPFRRLADATAPQTVRPIR